MKPVSILTFLSFMTLLANNSLAASREEIFVYPAVYPFKPIPIQEIYDTVTTVTEDQNFMRNLGDMAKAHLTNAQTASQPWTASYWPLAKGGIADPYENSSLEYNLDLGWIAWKENYKSLVDRRVEVHPFVAKLSQNKLDKLAPSEKYDILLGDKSFDLTHRVVEYMKKWGSEKKNAFITNISLVGEDTLELAKFYIEKFPSQYSTLEDTFRNSWTIKDTLSAKYTLDLLDEGKYTDIESAFAEGVELAKLEGENFVLKKQNSRMAVWEGICNGWSVAAGLVPRPRKKVSFNLPNGKKLNFYPEDIKALISLYYFNSAIQNQVADKFIDKDTKQPQIQGVLLAGKRCNTKKVKTDVWGRLYHSVKDGFTGEKESPCSGVHPATWHLGLVNLVGHQKRSFIVERKVGPAIDNHPVSNYELEYYNTEKRGKTFKPHSENNKYSLEDVLVNVEDDLFSQIRHQKTKFIVGVELKLTYMNYTRPNRRDEDSEDKDKKVDKKMFYDLELDKDLNIIGGQWRAQKRGQPSLDDKLNHNQPDFFWVVSKNFRKTGWFDNQNLEPWSDSQALPPKNWLESAKTKSFHGNEEQKVYHYGINENCKMKDKRTGKYIEVICESVKNRPLPLINVINKLIKLSK